MAYCGDQMGWCTPTPGGSTLILSCTDCDQGYVGCVDTWHSGGDGGNGGWGNEYKQLADRYVEMDEDRIRKLKAGLTDKQRDQLIELAIGGTKEQKRQRAYARIQRKLGELIEKINASAPSTKEQQRKADEDIKKRLTELKKEAEAEAKAKAPL